MQVLIDALPEIIKAIPDIRIFVAGPGDSENFLKSVPVHIAKRFTFLGRISEEEKADFLHSISAYVAPNTGGESFGIILAEALAGGAAVVASDIPAFDALLGHGKYGSLFTSEDSKSLSATIIDLLRDDAKRNQIRQAGREYAIHFDWEFVAERIYDVYEMSMVGLDKVTLSSDNRGWSKFLGI
jgi:phosphatidylinositol alpha-mannosyltransferase